MSYIDVIKNRRSIYSLNGEVSLTNDELKTLVGEVLRVTPDAFHMQSARVLLLLDEKSSLFWEKVNVAFDHSIQPEKFEGFRNAKGTVLFFIETDTVKALQEKFSLYADNFPVWAEQANGMLQINLWNALSDKGIGASLQHYNPVIDDMVHKDYEIPSSWLLRGQMPFGGIAAKAGEKEYMDLSLRMKTEE